jgi:prenyl protein peptidase
MVSQFPQVSTWTAVGLGGGFAFSYVALLYIFKAGRLVFAARAVEVGPGAERARLQNERWRNDPSVIRARLASVSLSTLASCGAVFAVLRAPNDTVRAL